jgi:hypothetical protein
LCAAGVEDDAQVLEVVHDLDWPAAGKLDAIGLLLGLSALALWGLLRLLLVLRRWWLLRLLRLLLVLGRWWLLRLLRLLLVLGRLEHHHFCLDVVDSEAPLRGHLL